MVSMNFEGLVTNIDTSGSVMQKEIPQGLFGDNNNIGVLFSPSELPATNCSYAFDANTGNRVGEDSPDDSRCGRGYFRNDTVIIPGSGKCPDDQTADQYADAYYFQPIDPNPTPRWRLDLGMCHQNNPQETLAAQKALLFKIATEADGEVLYNDRITRFGTRPSTYNEFIFESRPSVFSAYVWAHEGPFFDDIRDCPVNFAKCRLCTLRELCPSGSPRPNKPLVEIAQQQMQGDNFRSLTYDNITSYKDAVDNNGGYDADMIFRELSWEDVCGEGLSPSFSDACSGQN